MSDEHDIQNEPQSRPPKGLQIPIRLPSFPAFSKGERFSGPLFRCLFIGFITMLLLIPLGFVRDIVYERSYLHREATDNITGSWGRAQTVSGPALVIPYQTWQDRIEVKKVIVNGKEQHHEVTVRDYFTRHKVVLPDDLQFSTKLKPEIRYRGIYKQALYNAPVSIKGSFSLPEADEFKGNIHRVHWDKAWMAVGITDLKTISEAEAATWNGQTLSAYKPGTNVGYLLGPGFHIAVPVSEEESGQSRAFAMQLGIRGSGGISFSPVGERTTIYVAGEWPGPSFQGNLLPLEREIGEDGFTAKWIISNLTRTYPQIADLESKSFIMSQYSGEVSAITNFTAGVDLHENVTLYRMVMRAVNYGILFIAVSFVALFAFEMVTRQRMHLLQYGMVGLSMSLFYLVLLSLAEHTDFGLAFMVASAVTVGMNALYVGAALRNKKRGLLMGVILAALYTLLFSLLRMEDYALLVGTGLVLAMMAVLMYVTRALPQSKAAKG